MRQENSTHAELVTYNHTIERDHQHLKGRIRCLRSFKTDCTAQMVCAGHGFMHNLHQGFYRLDSAYKGAETTCAPRLMLAWDYLTTRLLAV